jgi:NRPS condensation-like uncharacterized protein
MQAAPLNVLDELYLHLDRKQEPWSVHLELEVEGRIDCKRLNAAVCKAVLAHPIARARLANARATDVRYRWEIADALTSIDLEEIECAREADLTRARERLLSRTPDLDTAGPFSLLLAHRPQGDVLVMNLHHAAGDGLSALRLMGSIARAYAGKKDRLPTVDALEVRDINAIAGSGSLKQRITRGRAAVEYLTRGVSTPARIAPQGPSDAPGYGFELLSFEPEELEHILELRSGGATVNDVLLGALAISVRRWNEQHGSDGGSVYLMMPINLRPPEWRFEVVGNFASYVSVHIGSDEQKTLPAAIKAATASTRRIKEDGISGLIIDLFALPSALPTGIKQRMQGLIPLTGNVIVDTVALSNLGRLPPAPDFADGGAVKAVWFSPPGRMPLGASLGAATLDDRLFLTLRYRHALFDARAASDFLATLRTVLTASPRRPAASPAARPRRSQPSRAGRPR